MNGDDDQILLLLHLRAGGHITFDLAARTTFGKTAARIAATEVIADTLLVAQVAHDIACVPPQRSIEALEGGNVKTIEAYADLVQDGLHGAPDGSVPPGCTRQFLSKALALGDANIIGAAVKLAVATKGTHRAHEGLETASNAVTAAFEVIESFLGLVHITTLDHLTTTSHPSPHQPAGLRGRGDHECDDVD